MGEQGWEGVGEEGLGVVGEEGWGVVRHRPHAQGLREVSLGVTMEGEVAKAGRERVEWRVEGWG